MIDIHLENLDVEREHLWEEGKSIVLSAPELFVDVDVEADGIAGYGSMLSIGAQSPTGPSFYSEIKPAYEEFIPDQKEFCEEHGLERERLIQEAPELSEVMSQFNDWLIELKDTTGKKPIFTAFNAGFDYPFVDLYFLKAGIRPDPFGVASFDLKSLALPLTEDWSWGMTSMKKLPKAILPPRVYTHNALEDAQYQQKVHFGMAALLGRTKYLNILESEK